MGYGNLAAAWVARGTAAVAVAAWVVTCAAVAAPNLCIENKGGTTGPAPAAVNKKHYDTAFRLFEAEARRGNAYAQMKLGIMYRLGVGVPQDFGMAISWWRLGAEGGNANAQCNLAFMYLYGTGIEQDSILAYMYFDLAAAEGHADARAKRDIVATWRLTAVELAEAQRLATQWRATH